METPLPNDSSKASHSPPVGRLRSFRRDWLTNKCSQNVLNIITNGYVLPFLSKPNLVRFPLILSEYKAQQKDQALATCIQSLLSKNAIERVENVKSLGFYSRLFLVPKPKVEASHRHKQAQHFSTRRKVQNGNSRVHHDLPDPRGVGIVDRSVGRCFHRDRPKISRNLPKWNLSVVLNELTKAPFEPMKDTDLKHLTLKTAFLLALASGKRRSEIHAWVANKVSNLGQWEKVALFPSSDFIAKNQLAREGSQSVSPVTIPALTTIVDRQFKEDRTLCPVRALRFHLDRTKDPRGSRSLLFISFKKGHTSDIRPATLSSWLKQTILLCYKQADQQALDLVQVKAHDIRAFAASKAFYGGVSVDQIM